MALVLGVQYTEYSTRSTVPGVQYLVHPSTHSAHHHTWPALQTPPLHATCRAYFHYPPTVGLQAARPRPGPSQAWSTMDGVWMESSSAGLAPPGAVNPPLHYAEPIEIAVSINCPDPQNV